MKGRDSKGSFRLKPATVLCAVAIASAFPGSAQAGELFTGFHVHDVKTPLDKSGIESGVDLSLGFRANSIGHLWGGSLRPYIFGAINTAGNTDYAAAGMSATFPIGSAWYFRPGIGLAVHNGSAGKYYRTDKIAFGSRVLLEPEIGIGVHLSHDFSVEASWVHMSHGQLFGKENPGIDNLGMRLNLAL
jgi:hypothetical protein